MLQFSSLCDVICNVIPCVEVMKLNTFVILLQWQLKNYEIVYFFSCQQIVKNINITFKEIACCLWYIFLGEDFKNKNYEQF